MILVSSGLALSLLSAPTIIDHANMSEGSLDDKEITGVMCNFIHESTGGSALNPCDNPATRAGILGNLLYESSQAHGVDENDFIILDFDESWGSVDQK